MLTLRKYNYDAGRYEVIGEVDLHTVGRSISPEQLIYVLSAHCNGVMGSPSKTGKAMGEAIAGEHRALQDMMLHVLYQTIAEAAQQYDRGWYDGRNEHSLRAAHAVRDLLAGDPHRYYFKDNPVWKDNGKDNG